MKNENMKNEKRAGWCNIKHVDIYHMLGLLVPEQFRDNICPKRSDKIIKSVRAERKSKRDTSKYT